MGKLVIAVIFAAMSGIACAQQSSTPATNPLDGLNQRLDESRDRAGAAAATLRDRQKQDEETLRELDRLNASQSPNGEVNKR
jgi:hypothetical protein